MFEIIYFYAPLSPFDQRPLALESTGKQILVKLSNLGLMEDRLL